MAEDFENTEVLEDLDKLNLHKDIWLDDLTQILRVPGGFIYKFYSEDKENQTVGDLVSTKFVPYHGTNESKYNSSKEKIHV